MRFLSAMTGVLLAGSVGVLNGQQQRTFHMHLGAGGAATGGGGYRDNGGAFGRLGFDFNAKAGWFIQPNASLFGRLVSGGCIDLSSECSNPFPSTLSAITLDVVGVVSAAPFARHPIAFSAGVGPAFIGSSAQAPSETTFASEVGSEMVLVGGRQAALTFAAHGMLLPNVHGHAIWLVPLTLGVAF